MQRSVHCGDKEIVFTVKRSRRRRSVALRIEPSGAITVYAPTFVWSPFIDRFVRQQTDWITKKLAFFKERIQRATLVPPLSEQDRTDSRLKTEERLPAVIERLSKQLDVIPRSVRVANQNKRWGSCSSKGHIRFSWKMAALPDPVFDYIVTHELAHLKQMNHSPRFWAVVSSICPDYKVHRKWLRQNA